MVRNVVLKIINVVIVVYSVALSIVVGTAPTVNSETHSLTYIYTALSKPVGLPGIHQFSAMGLLDGRMIDYFDSEHQKKVPKQDWMKERLDPDYWEKGTESHLNDQLWFKVSLNTLMKRMGHKDSDLHVLQWMRGCEGNMQPDSSITFHRGKNIYSYDGNNFLSFNYTNNVWVPWTEVANETKKEWGDQFLTDYRLYLENECMESLRKFVDYQRTHLQNAPPPEVFMFSKDTKVETKVMLTCLATGFYPKDVTLNIKRNGRVLTKEDGVVTSGVRPNDDDTFQRRDSVEILRTDTSTFTCEVNHPASRLHVEEERDHKLPPGPEGLVPILAGVFVVVIGLIVVAVGLVLLYQKGVFRSRRPRFVRSDEFVCISESDVFRSHGSLSSDVSGVPTAVNDEVIKAKGPDAVRVTHRGSRRPRFVRSRRYRFVTAQSLSVITDPGSDWSRISQSGFSSAQPLSVITDPAAVNGEANTAQGSDDSLSSDDSGMSSNSAENKNSSVPKSSGTQ